MTFQRLEMAHVETAFCKTQVNAEVTAALRCNLQNANSGPSAASILLSQREQNKWSKVRCACGLCAEREKEWNLRTSGDVHAAM